MPQAIDVAEYLVHLAASEAGEDRDPICNLRLQKLLYYAQGWHLAAFGRVLFAGRVEAWTHGPVVKEVYPVFKGQYDIQLTRAAELISLPDEAKKFVRWVWERYKGDSASALRTKTHQEAPWLDARGDLPADAWCDREITPESMRAYFLPRYIAYLRRQDARIDPAAWKKSAEDFAAGRARPAEEILREVRSRRT